MEGWKACLCLFCGLTDLEDWPRDWLPDLGPSACDEARLEGTEIASGQVWSLTQFYSVDFSKSRMDVKQCVFNKRTIKVCISCS